MIERIVTNLIWAAIVIFLSVRHQEEKKDLHLRLSTKSLEDYHYWRDNFPLEVAHNKEILEQTRKEAKAKVPLTAEELELKKTVEGY